MKNAGQIFLYLCKISSTKFDLESNWNILNEKRRPEFPTFLQTLLNEIRFRIKLKHSEWKTQARISFKLSSTKVDWESNWNFFRSFFWTKFQTFLNEIRSRIKLKISEKGRPEIPLSSQSLLNEIRFRVKLKPSEWKRQARNSFKLSSTKFNLESNWNILNEKGRPEIPLNFPFFLILIL